MNSFFTTRPANTSIAQRPNYGRCLANAEAYKQQITPLLQQQANIIKANGGTGPLNEMLSILPGGSGRGPAIRDALGTIKRYCDEYGRQVQSCELTYKNRTTPNFTIPYPSQCGYVEK